MLGRVILNRYEIVRFLGHGNMGQVWLARDRMLQRDAVIKSMNERVASAPRFRDLFRREMEVMAAFRHPHAVEFYDSTSESPLGPCLIMEFVAGVSLDKVLSHRRFLVPERVGDLLVPLCQALHAAHKGGIVHRDLKPSNLMVVHLDQSDEKLKVMDLGLAALSAKPHIPLERLRGQGDDYAAGTPAYVCPELLRGDAADHRGDIYSLGVVLFELLTGRLPFDDSDTQKILQGHAYRQPPTFQQVGMGVIPPAVERIVQMCLAKYPNERPYSAYELACRFQSTIGRDPALDPRLFEPTVAPKPAPASPNKSTEQIVERFEAWMPEPVAVTKLRGFVHDMGGQIVGSEPGLIRVQLDVPQNKPKSSLFNWPRKSVELPSMPPVALDLHMTRAGSTGGKLSLQVVFRAVAGPLPRDPNWHQRCQSLLTKLRSYLMA